LTTPANALCARAVVGHASRHASAHTDSSSLLMLFLLGVHENLGLIR
jgi:hypothetical protein